MPQLYAHFKKHNFKVEMFAQEWLMCFFCGYLNQEQSAAVIDNFVLEGWPAIYRISIALLRLYEDDLLEA